MKRKLREEARRLRTEGMSVREIAKTLNISLSSASTWVRDITLSETQVEALKANQRLYGAQNAGAASNRENGRKRRVSYQETGKIKAQEMRPLHMMGCMLYWAEGAKSRNRIYFANSDPNMQKLFIRFLREELNVTDSEITIYIHCHTSDPDEMYAIEDFWLNCLNLARSNHRKTYIKKGSEIQHSILEHGVCGVAVYRTDLVQHIFGAIQEYGGFDNPNWLR
ncbi:MAG: hypothetical protein K8L97_25475 [Anaerolineae bacterium]|nr:hypothetical protein [Anaerolineae bacterium]